MINYGKLRTVGANSMTVEDRFVPSYGSHQGMWVFEPIYKFAPYYQNIKLWGRKISSPNRN